MPANERQIANFRLLMAAERALIGYEIDPNEIEGKEIGPKKDAEKEIRDKKIDRNRNEGMAHHLGR